MSKMRTLAASAAAGCLLLVAMATVSWQEGGGGGGGGRGGGGRGGGGVEELLMPSHSEMASAVSSRLAERFKREDSALKIKLGIFNTPHDSLKEISEGDMKTNGEGDVDGGASANQGVFGRGAAGLGSMAQRGDPFSSLLQVQASAGGITAADDMSEAGLTTNHPRSSSLSWVQGADAASAAAAKMAAKGMALLQQEGQRQGQGQEVEGAQGGASPRTMMLPMWTGEGEMEYGREAPDVAMVQGGVDCDRFKKQRDAGNLGAMLRHSDCPVTQQKNPMMWPFNGQPGDAETNVTPLAGETEETAVASARGGGVGGATAQQLVRAVHDSEGVARRSAAEQRLLEKSLWKAREEEGSMRKREESEVHEVIRLKGELALEKRRESKLEGRAKEAQAKLAAMASTSSGATNSVGRGGGGGGDDDAALLSALKGSFHRVEKDGGKWVIPWTKQLSEAAAESSPLTDHGAGPTGIVR